MSVTAARSAAAPPAPARADNRRAVLLDAAARLFRERGYDAASMRHIASAVGMLPGSVYYHFASKDELLCAVYEEGVRRIRDAVEAALARETAPWARLSAAAAAHLEVLLGDNDYGAVVIRLYPTVPDDVRDRLTALRDGYEAVFRDLIDALPLAAGVDRHYLRLHLFGALNWTPTWYRPGGDAPGAIASQIISHLRQPLGGDPS